MYLPHKCNWHILNYFCLFSSIHLHTQQQRKFQSLVIGTGTRGQWCWLWLQLLVHLLVQLCLWGIEAKSAYAHSLRCLVFLLSYSWFYIACAWACTPSVSDLIVPYHQYSSASAVLYCRTKTGVEDAVGKNVHCAAIYKEYCMFSRWFQKVSVDGALTTSPAKWFQSTIVLTKNDCLYCSVRLEGT